MTAARPPVWRRRRKSARNSNSVFFVLAIVQQVLGGGLVVEASGEGWIGEDERVLLRVVIVGLRQRIPVADVRILRTVQQHVHAADAKHGAVKVVAVERAFVEAAAGGSILVDSLAIVLDQILGGGDKEARRAASRVADDILRRRRGHVDHQLDDMTRGAELPVLPGGRDLAEHVLVEVALGVAVGHVDAVELIHHVRQHAGRGHHEEGVSHVVCVRRASVAIGVPALPQGLHEGEHLVAHGREHLLGSGLPEARPANGVLIGSEDWPFDGLTGACGLALLQRVQLVEPFDEEEVGQLLDDREGVRNAP